jgi:hypothetical protein
MTTQALIAAAEAALESGEWVEARGLLDQLGALRVRGAGIPGLAAIPAGAQLQARQPEYAKVLQDRIDAVNGGRRRRD